jgi:molybdopterin converting factor small subunit
MRVKVRFTGMIRHYVGMKERDYELPEGSTAGDLLRLLGRDYGRRMPAQMWDGERERFHPLVIAMRKGEPLAGGDGPLRDGDEIFLLSRLAGG